MEQSKKRSIDGVIFESPRQYESKKEKPLLEMASGIVAAELYDISLLASLGIQRQGFQAHAYDMIGNGVLTELDGVLGLDF